MFCTLPLKFGWYCLFGSENTLKEQLDKEKAALQQSIHKNSALISEKDQQVKSLRSEVRIYLFMHVVPLLLTELLSMHKISSSRSRFTSSRFPSAAGGTLSVHHRVCSQPLPGFNWLYLIKSICHTISCFIVGKQTYLNRLCMGIS